MGKWLDVYMFMFEDFVSRFVIEGLLYLLVIFCYEKRFLII